MTHKPTAHELSTTRPWSCDTFYAAADRHAEGVAILGKNSDRPARECQPLRFHPARDGSADLRLAYVTIPDAPSNAHLGASPYWCWGHELGVNSYGVAIGNEALFTRSLADAIAQSRSGTAPEPGILGMELLRLGLERGDTAEQALEVMTSLLERYGQWGTGVGGQQPEQGAYDNSYLIADDGGAWVLETSGRSWAARRVEAGSYSISNQPTIRDREADRTSPALRKVAVESGWWPADAEGFDFARAVQDPRTPLQASVLRLQRSRQLLSGGKVDERRAMRVLRDHFEGTFIDGPFFSAGLPDLLTLCMHEHPAGFTWGNTASSMVCTLPQDDLVTMWWAAGTPCTGVYVPVWVDSGSVPESLSRAGTQYSIARPPENALPDQFDAASYWWNFLKLLEATKGNELAERFAERQPRVRAAFDALEGRWLEETPRVRREARAATDSTTRAAILATYTQSCVNQATTTLSDLLASFVDARSSLPVSRNAS